MTNEGVPMSKKPTDKELKRRVKELEIEIAKWKRAEEKLRGSEERYRILFEDSREAKSLSQDGKIVDLNQPWLELHGFKDKNEVIGKDILDFIHPNDGKILIERRGKWPEKMEPVYEIRDVRKDGSVVSVEVYSSGISIGGKDAVLATIHDITKRKEAEEILRENEERYRSLVESTKDSIYLVDRNYRYQFMNQKHLSRLGLAKDKVLGRKYAEFHSEDDTKEFVETIENVFKTGRSVQHEHRSSRDGRYFLRTLSPIKKSDGRTISVTVVSKNIDERKQAEEASKQISEKIKLFAYSVSHDLKSPAFAIYGLTKRFYKNHGDILGEKGKKYCDKILKASEQIAMLVEQINIYPLVA